MLSSGVADGSGERLVWSQKYSVGVNEIDSDHKVLIELIGQIDSAAAGSEAHAVIGTVLAALFDYTEYHFEREEKMMQTVGYTVLPQHKQKHDLLKSQVIEYLGRYSDDPNSVNIEDLSKFLQRWLSEHILKEDMGYRPLVENNPKAGEAAASVGIDFFMDVGRGD